MKYPFTRIFTASIVDSWSYGYIDGDEENIRRRSRPRITWKHSWDGNQMQDALSGSPFSSIPNEILFQIFKLLPIRDLGNVSLVCRFFKTIACQDEIWQSRCGSKY